MLEMELPIKNRATQAPPREAMVFVANGCNVDCPYCFVAKTPEKMSIETARNIIDFLLRQRGLERRTNMGVSAQKTEKILSAKI